MLPVYLYNGKQQSGAVWCLTIEFMGQGSDALMQIAGEEQLACL